MSREAGQRGREKWGDRREAIAHSRWMKLRKCFGTSLRFRPYRCSIMGTCQLFGVRFWRPSTRLNCRLSLDLPSRRWLARSRCCATQRRCGWHGSCEAPSTPQQESIFPRARCGPTTRSSCSKLFRRRFVVGGLISCCTAKQPKELPLRALGSQRVASGARRFPSRCCGRPEPSGLGCSTSRGPMMHLLTGDGSPIQLSMCLTAGRP